MSTATHHFAAPSRSRSALLLAATALALTSCATGADVDVPEPDQPATLEVTTSAFTDGGDLPAAFTCDGAGDFPPVAWGGLPSATVAVAVLVHDPDAPGGDFVHRLVTNLDPAGGLLGSAATPDVALELRTSEDRPGWVPPCPPEGDGAHRYVFTVYALNRPTRLPDTAQTQTAVATVTEAAVAHGRLVAQYARP